MYKVLKEVYAYIKAPTASKDRDSRVTSDLDIKTDDRKAELPSLISPTDVEGKDSRQISSGFL